MTSQPARKRLRASHACDNCRARKTRCDGSHPCETCCALQQECTFGLETNSRGKSDIILEGIQRIERAVNELNQNIATSSSERPIQPPPHRQSIDHATPRRPPPPPFSASPATEHSSTGAAHHHTGTSLGEASNAFHDATDGFENAILESMHTSNTEAVLQWPHLNNFPSLRNDYIPVYELEQSREPLRAKSATVLPFVDPDDVDATLEAFERNVNFWYPTMSLDQLQTSREILNSSHDSEDTPETCLALLTMALGCASQVTQGLAAAARTELDEEADKRKRASRRRLGDLYFENALKRLYVAHTSVSSAATQCLFFVALYFAFQTRPLQAWEYISATSAKCLLLLAYSSDRDAAQDQERIRRIFWSCYILESDYVAELSSCPSSGIARVESSIPLPGSYQTHADSVAEEQSSLYFLACISMRRLLNRVHHLLYARDTGAARNQERFPYIVAELQHQLDDWRDVLPPSFAFSLDTEATVTETGGFLRQRYLTCRSVIYRPYLMWQLSRGPSGGGDLTALGPDALNNCKICLDSCLAHILNLKGFSHTVLVDTWICSLSMAGAMLVLLAACGVPTLRELISEEIIDAGDHLTTMLEGWQRLVGIPVSPSVSQSSWIIYAADKFIKEAYT